MVSVPRRRRNVVKTGDQNVSGHAEAEFAAFRLSRAEPGLSLNCDPATAPARQLLGGVDRVAYMTSPVLHVKGNVLVGPHEVREHLFIFDKENGFGSAGGGGTL